MFDEPSGGVTQAETGQMTSAAIEAGTVAEGLDLLLRNLMDNLEPLMAAWKGMGGTRFQEIKLAVQDEMQTLNRALKSIGEDMGLSSADYAAADEEIAETIAAAGAMDGGEITRLLDSNTTEVQQLVHSGGSQGQIADAMNSR